MRMMMNRNGRQKRLGAKCKMRRWQLQGSICFGKRFKPREAIKFEMYFRAFGIGHAKKLGVEKLRGYISEVAGTHKFALGVTTLRMGDATLILRGPLSNKSILRIRRIGNAFEEVGRPLSRKHAMQLARQI